VQLGRAKYGLGHGTNSSASLDYGWDKAGNRASVTNKLNGVVTGYGSNAVNQYTNSAALSVTRGTKGVRVGLHGFFGQ